MEISYKILIVSSSSRTRFIASLFNNTLGEPGSEGITVRDEGSATAYRLHFVEGFDAAFVALRSQPFQGLILEGDFDGQSGLRFLQTLSNIPYNIRNVTPRQVLLLYIGEAPSADTLLRLGKLNAGGVHVVNGGKRKGERTSIFHSLSQVLRPRNSGKTAICLAGGGIEGLIYETGVLRAIDEILVGRSVTEFDHFYGISAGSVVSSIVANGVPPSEIAKAFMLDSTVISPIKSSSLFDPAISEIGGRLLSLITSSADERGWLFPRLFSVIPSALFKGDRIEKMLEKGFSEVGRTNSFEELGGKLFIGATDQDTSEHIVFGTPGWEHVPISRAIHASLSLIPFYAPQCISGRWFIDGSFT
ncbi:patatin-like phospholipase family protein, partial [Myxococcota bacterium]|nr:patatin-like phospholipase family protein [Myxococcota bacterium]